MRGFSIAAACALLSGAMTGCTGYVRTSDAGFPTDGSFPDSGSSDSGLADAGSDAGSDGGSLTGCGSGGGGPLGGPADLFPCDSVWYQDVSDPVAFPAAPESNAIIGAIADAGGWGAGNQFRVTFDFVLLHANVTTPSYDVWIQPIDGNDTDPYYADESDVLPLPSVNRGYPVPTPDGGWIEGHADYQCPIQFVGSTYSRSEDCHLTLVDDVKHVLYELGSSTFDEADQHWYASQESVWNLDWHYSANERGLWCTSADAAGLAISPGLVGLRETLAASQQPNGLLKHALRFILPNSRIQSALVPPASHLTFSASLALGPPYGTRLRLRADFPESSVTSVGGRALLRTLKKYGMILADGGQIALTAEREDYYKAQDPSLTWAGVLGDMDLVALSISDFEVVQFGTVQSGHGNCQIDETPLSGVLP